MKLLQVVATVAAIGALTACNNTTVTQNTGSSSTGGSSSSSTSGGSSSTSTSTSTSATTPAPPAGTKVSGDAIAGQIREGIKGQAGVKFKEVRRDKDGAVRSSTTGTANGEFAVKDPLTGKYNDTSTREENTVVVDGVAYGYYRRASMWVKASDKPSDLELSFKSAYTAQLCKLDPRVIIEMVAGGQGESKGEADVDGVKATRYSVSNTVAKLMEKQVNGMKAHGCDVLAVPSNKTSYDRAQTGSTASRTFTLDVYLAPDGKLLRYDEPFNASSSSTSASRTSISYTEWGTAVNPAPPSDAKTFAEARQKATSSSSSTTSAPTAA